MSEKKSTSHKKNNMEKLTVRDFITMALFLVLVFIVYSVVGMSIGLAFPIYSAVFIHAGCSLF